MTSRRSRLKAVTNLPVRRKTFATTGNGNENVAVNNITSEKVYTCALNEEEISQVKNEEKQVKDIKSKYNESSGALNNAVDLKNSTSCAQEIVSKTDGSINPKILEQTNDINSYYENKLDTESNNVAVFQKNKHFKSNIVSGPVKEKAQVQTSEKRKDIENLTELNCITVSNNNNIVEDGFKCYTVLTSQNLTLSPLSEYTITPLTPCSNAYIDTTENEVNHPQEYEGVKIYTEIESDELYINNEINESSESVIETQSFEPVLTNLTNCSTEFSVKSSSPVSQNTNYKRKHVSENADSKPLVKRRTVSNVKNVFGGNNEVHEHSDIIGNSISSICLEYSDLSCKQSTSTVSRRRRSNYNDFTKKLADAKREFQKKYEKTKPDRSTLKMIDLIFYNPATNPMESKVKFEKKGTSLSSSDLIHDLLDEEKVDEPESMDSSSKSNFFDNCDTESMNKMPVPQVKIGLDGEIILDEKSLVIETTDAKKGREGLQNSVPVFEEKECKVSYYRGKSKKTRDWADFETKRFYKALNTIGPDFTLMQKYFPKRSRLELKNKFKREERLNRSLIDKALNNPSEFDMTQLEKDLAIEKEAEEVELEMRLRKIMKRAVRKKRVKTSYLSREIIETDDDTGDSEMDSIVSVKASSEIEKNKKEKEFDLVFQKLLMKESEKSVNVLPEISSSSNSFQFSDQGVT